jgi:peptidoglycan hydrolase-like protein with peptidoglycan-binding domain
LTNLETFLEDEDQEHGVPADLLELYEVLEFNGLVELPEIPRQAVRRSSGPIPGTVISRAQWGARPPKGAYGRMSSRRGSTAHYEGPRMGIFPHSSCVVKVRGIQAFHMDGRGWTDIAYNTIECPHGEIFMGRGNARSAANGTNAGNDSHFAHCVLIGVGDEFPNAAQYALRAAFRIAREQWGAGAEEKVHGDWKATACPGDPIRAFVRSGMQGGGSTPAPTPTPTPPATDNFKERVMAKATLRQGATGHDVKIFQGLLIAHGAVPVSEQAGFADGNFGPRTNALLRSWQTKTGVLNKSELGFCGPRTWAWLVNV